MQGDHALTNAAGTFGIASKPQSDAVFLLQIAQGDRHAMHMLFVRYQVRVYRYARRLTNNHAVAQDVVSDVFLEVWRHAAKFDGRSQVATWLLGITRNLAATISRRRPTKRLDQSIADSIPDPADDPEAVMGKTQRNSILATCLTKLSAPHREVIDLVYYHEKSINEVAEITGIAPNTVKTRMFYARKEIAEHLKQFGFWSRSTLNGARPAPRGRGKAVLAEF